MHRDSTPPETTSTKTDAALPGWLSEFDNPSLDKKRTRVLGASRTLFATYPGPVLLFVCSLILAGCLMFVSTLWPITSGGRG